MKTILPAGEFKTRCLKLIDEVAQMREPLVITKRGKPVAEVIPIPSHGDFVGSMCSSAIWEGDIISPAMPRAIRTPKDPAVG